MTGVQTCALPISATPPEVSITGEPTTAAPVTEAPTTQAPATEAPTTQAPTTQAPTTQAPTTRRANATLPPATQAATTAPATAAPTQPPPATAQPATTLPATTQPATTLAATQPPTTQAPTTKAPTTTPPTTQAPATQPPTTLPPATTQPPAPVNLTASPFPIEANSVFAGNQFPPSLATDGGGDATSWFSAGAGGPTPVLSWRAAGPTRIRRVEVYNNLQNPIASAAKPFGFANVKVEVLNGDQVVFSVDAAYPRGAAPSHHTDVTLDVVGTSIRLTFTGPDDLTCGGISDLKVFGNPV